MYGRQPVNGCAVHQPTKADQREQDVELAGRHVAGQLHGRSLRRQLQLIKDPAEPDQEQVGRQLRLQLGQFAPVRVVEAREDVIDLGTRPTGPFVFHDVAHGMTGHDAQMAHDAALQRMQTGANTFRQVSEVFVTSENLLASMDRVTGMYAALAA